MRSESITVDFTGGANTSGSTLYGDNLSNSGCVYLSTKSIKNSSTDQLNDTNETVSKHNIIVLTTRFCYKIIRTLFY
jgi:hypothetical protein